MKVLRQLCVQTAEIHFPQNHASLRNGRTHLGAKNVYPPWAPPSWSKEYLSTSGSLVEYSVPVVMVLVVMGRVLGPGFFGFGIRNCTLSRDGEL